MKRNLLNLRSLKHAVLAVPAAALMLGAAEAGTTVGLNFQTWYYDSGHSPQTIGFMGTGYSAYNATGFPVTATAFGIGPANWFNTDPLYGNANGAGNPINQACTFGGSSTNFAGGLSCFVNSPVGGFQSGIGCKLASGLSTWPSYAPGVFCPQGEDEALWGIIVGNTNSPFSVSVSGLAAKFPNGYVIQALSAHGGNATVNSLPGVSVTDGAATNTVAYHTWVVTNSPNAQWKTATAGLADPSGTFTADTIYLNSGSDATNILASLAGVIITDQPVVSQKPIGGTYNSGVAITLTGGAVGILPISYQWTHAGTNIPGATTNFYTIPSAGAADTGDYSLIATNQYGAGTSVVATVTVLMVPTIQTDIHSATNYQSMNQLFFVSAGGAQTLYFQWTHANTNLPGATSASLLLTNLQATDAGDYTCIVTNALGRATSSVATLTLVSPAPYDGFDYPVGTLLGANGGAGWAGPWTQTAGYNGTNDVATPGANYRDTTSQLVTTGGYTILAAEGTADFENIRILQATLGGASAATIYVSFIGQILNTGWGGLELAWNGNSQVLLGANWYASNWGWGDRGNFNSQSAHSGTPSSTEAFLVYRFDYTPTNVLVRLYVNPSLPSEPASASVSGTWSTFQFNQVRLVAHGPAVNNGLIDEVRLGGSWAAVAPSTPRTDPPVIVKDLAGITNYVFAGANATMSITADGAPTLHYVWLKNGTTQVGTDSPTLTLTGLTTADAADYSVVVTNNYGSAPSQTNHLTVLASPDSYTTTALADSPAAYWPLNEAGPYTAYDYSGSGNNGTQNGTLTPGLPGPRPPTYAGFSSASLAYQFDGASAYVECGTAPAISGTSDFTVEAWINTTNPAGSYILQQRSGYNGEYMLVLNANGTVHFTIYGGGNYQYDFSTPVSGRRVNDGAWHHVAAVRSGTNGVIYIDGSAMASANGTLRPLDPTFTVAIGKDARDNASYFNGFIANAAIYTHALPAANIAAHAATGFLNGAPLQLSHVPGGWVQDTKPVGTPDIAANLGATWVAASTNGSDPNTYRTGVVQFASGAQIAAPANPDFNSPTGSICFWMRTGLPAKGNGTILFDRRTTAGLLFYLDGTPSGGIDVQYTGGPSFATGNYVVDGNWHQVTLLYDQSASGFVTLYVDGILALSQPNTSAWSWPTNQQIELGRSHDTYWQEYTGQMDDFRIYNRLLNDSEISAIATLATSDTLVDTTALKVRYNFDTATGVGSQLTWPLGVLRVSPTLGPAAWVPVNTTSPSYPFQPVYPATTNAAAFFRVQQ